jgi:hypothetical protein
VHRAGEKEERGQEQPNDKTGDQAEKIACVRLAGQWIKNPSS